MTHRSPNGSDQSTIPSGLWAGVWLVSLALSGCVTTPPTAGGLPPTPVAVPSESTIRGPTCPPCNEQSGDVARLRQDLANREAELRELRSNQRDQVKVIQESTREATRAKVRLRRLATQADAASYIAEVEVALELLRSKQRATSTVPMVVLAQDILESTAEPFAQGDYGTAMDRAAHAEQLIALAAANRVRPGETSRSAKEMPLQVAIPLKVTVDSNLHRQPVDKAPVVGVLKKDSPLVARASKGTWMRVETGDGRSGWVAQTRLGAR